ncbi:MAG TPA: sigma-70 family RNA polymerase sigma factor, partial [Chitinophagaceae bacterium]
MKHKKYDHISDATLLEYYYSDHNQEWIGVLLERYTLLLLGVCMKYLKNEEEAKDAVQHIFLKVLTEVDKYKIEYFKSWLYMVAKNYCLMKLRGQKHIIELSDKHIEQPDNRKQDLLENEKTFSLLETAIEELNEEQKQCV